VKFTNLGRFVQRCSCHRTESWFKRGHDHDNKEVLSFEQVLEEIQRWLSKNENICEIELIEKVAKDKIAKSKFIEEDNCVICFSKKPTVTFFPCGHKVFCCDCHKISHEDHQENSCACCRQKIKFYKVDVEKRTNVQEI